MVEGSGTDVEDCVSRTVDSDLNENSEDGRVIAKRAVLSKMACVNRSVGYGEASPPAIGM